MENLSTNTASNNTSSQSTSRDFPSKSEGIVWCSAFALEAVLILVGNLVTIVLFAVDKKLRKKSLFLVVNMALCDAMVGAVSLPTSILLTGITHQLWIGKLQWSMHTFLKISQTVFVLASLFSASLISGERFYAISCPLKHRTLSMRAYRIAIFIAWMLPILLSMVIFLSPVNKLVNSVLSAFMMSLLFIVCGLNIGMWRKFHHESMALHQQNRVLQNKRLTKTLSFVSVMVVLSWLPICISFLISFFKVLIPSTCYLAASFLGFSNSFFNPIVYALRIPEFKQALGFCRLRSTRIVNREDNEGNDNRVAAQLRTLPADPSHLQLAFEQEVMDTKL